MKAMPKSRYGEGSLFRRRPGGNFHMQFYVRGKKYGPVSTGTPCRTEASRIRSEAIVKAHRRGRLDGTATLGDLFDLIVEDYQRRRLRTLPQLRSRLKRLERVAAIRTADFNKADLTEYILACEDAGDACATVNRDLEVLRRAFRLGEREQIVERVPHIEMLPEDNIRTGYLEHSDYQRLRNCLREPVRLMLVVAYHTGARSGAIRSLTWDQVDLEAKVIHPPPNTSNKRLGHWPIYGDLERALWEARARRGRDFPNTPWVIYNQATGERYSDHRKAWASGLALAELPAGLMLHDLRRSACRNMLAAGIDESTVMRILGHKTRAMLDRYNIVNSKQIAKAGQDLETYLQGRSHEDLGGESVQ